MTSIPRLHAVSQDYRLSRRFFARLWRLTRPYWADRHSRKSWFLMGLTLLLVPTASQVYLWATRCTGDMTNALVAKDQAAYTPLFWKTTLLLLCWGLISVVLQVLSARINVDWRRWLTDYLIRRYLDSRTYYDITLREDLDNPDQRIQEQVMPFVAAMSDTPRQLIGQVAQLMTGGFIVASVSSSLVAAVVIYALVQTIVMLLMYTPLIRLQFDSTIAEADLRRGLLHVREQAETVAFYRGEETEYDQLRHRLGHAVQRQWSVLRYQGWTSAVSELTTAIWNITPFFLIAPLFFQGKIDYGAIAMATASAAVMMRALTTLSAFVPTLTAMAPGAVRLAQILERFDAVEASQPTGGNRLVCRDGERVVFESVDLYTPGGERQLTRGIDLTVAPGQRLIIVGPTGIGKSSVLRAMAGLWQRGSGVVTMPAPQQCLFLPQRPYMMLADLRSQLLYPRAPAGLDDEYLLQALRLVQLPELADRHGGLSAVRDWAKVLSLGEQQRIGFARALISEVKYVFLDEATSAVDVTTEKILYQLLQKAGLTYISVGHRPTLMAYHDIALVLEEDGCGFTVTTRALAAHLSRQSN